MRTWSIILIALLAVVCYHLPWYTHSTAGFTMNAFDLAEFASLHPAVRSDAPLMFTSLLLRLPLTLIAFALALSANLLDDPRLRWILRGVALLVALRMFPPTDFFTGESADPNYRQMLWVTLTGLVLIIVAIPLSRFGARWNRRIVAAVLGIASIAGWMGLSRTATLMDNFQIDVHTGLGIVGLTVLALIAISLAVWTDLPRFSRLSTATE
jgi:hypothetical protein